MPSDYIPIRGLCPSGEGDCEFFLSKSAIRALRRQKLTWKLRGLTDGFVETTLARPDVIFRDLMRDGMHDAYCYSAAPPPSWKSETGVAPLCGMVFLVFVAATHGWTVTDWDWRKEHEAMDGYPAGYKVDFGDVAWKRS